MRLAVDVGGTFTDLVLVDDASAQVWVDKVPSTPASGDAVARGIGRITTSAGVERSAIELLFHGFTIATNAWLTRSGARVALLVSAGFGDILAIGSQRRPHTYDLAAVKPQPLVPRSHVLEVHERIDAFGTAVLPLNDLEIARVLEQVAALEPEAIAISLLFSWSNAEHEERLLAALEHRCAGVPIYLSSIVNPQIEEYPRANTTAAAAYVGPPVRRYTEALEAALGAAGVAAPLRYMRSDGGAATALAARDNPASMLLSGPAGGVVAALAVGEQIGVNELITFDMGGTSADFSVIRGGEATLVRDRMLDGLPLRVPMLDIKAISAGGGSIAWVDRGGALRVGPASAGAVPGPACYANGGALPTLTDAALLLGFLQPSAFAGGELCIAVAPAENAIRDEIAVPLGLSVQDAARGMVDVATANMAQAIRELSTARGDDVAEFALLAFGGAGGIFAPYLLRELGLGEVLVPRYPGVFAALGLLHADLRHHAQAPFPAALDNMDSELLRGRLTAMAVTLDAQLEGDGVPQSARNAVYSADMRYIGQHHQLEVTLPAPAMLDAAAKQHLAIAFHDIHERRYGYCQRDDAVEITNLHVVGVGVQSKPASFEMAAAQTSALAPCATRRVALGRDGQYVETAIFVRDDLQAGDAISGPAVVIQNDSTLLILSGQQARVDRFGFIHLKESSDGD
ncbi:MAG: N-methylhydantoinase A [Gammaproteobacteria bacterium]|jgi:N-methylhydantoinase A